MKKLRWHRRNVRALATWCLTTLSLVTVYNACSKEGFSSRNYFSAVEDTDNQSQGSGVSGSITINNGDLYASQTSVTLGLMSADAKDMYITNTSDCSNGGSWQKFETTSPWDLADKNRKIAVFVKFRKADGAEGGCVSASIVHDDQPPAIVVDTQVPALTNINFLGIDFHATDDGSGINKLYCILPNQVSAVPCSSYTGKKLIDGGYVVKFLADDKAGNLSEPTSLSFTVDGTPPEVSINTMPPSLTGASSATFGFSGADNLSGVQGYECLMDQQSMYLPCTSPMTVTGLSQGQHTFSVRAVDLAGNISLAASYSWTVDLTQPSIRFTQTPPAMSNSSTAVFGFSGEDKNGNALAQFECRVAGSSFAPCTSLHTLSGLSEGSYTFGVRGINALGIASAELTYSWIVDLTPPALAITQGPRLLTNSTSADFAFTVTETRTGVASVACSLDGGAYVNCASLIAHFTNLGGDRSHTFQVRAIDGAGNSTQSAVYSWTIDLTSPTIEITAHPPALATNGEAQFQLNATDLNGPITYQCRLDSATEFAPCGPNPSFTGLSDGSHTFSARAADAAGNLSSVVTYSWKVDTVGPVITLTQTPPSTILTTDSSSISYTITDNISTVTSVTCTLDLVAVACQVPNDTVNFPPLAAGTHTFIVTATNSAGISSTQSFTFTSRAPNCVTTLSSTTILTKMLFVIDTSGSNQSSVNCAIGANCTDPGKKMRAGSIQAFFDDYGPKSNFAWAFNTFQDTTSTALINSGLPSAPMFSDAAVMQNAINGFKTIKDANATPYLAALNLAVKAISSDPDLKSSKNPQYIVVFMSDGQPTQGTTTQILSKVKDIVDLSPGRVSFNSVYYGPANDTASGLLQKMANTGSGNFLNTNTNPTGLNFKISDLVSVPATVCH